VRPIFYVAFFLMVFICMALLLMVTIFVFLGVLVLPAETGPYAIRYAYTHAYSTCGKKQADMSKKQADM
jgi:hypothetical protein